MSAKEAQEVRNNSKYKVSETLEKDNYEIYGYIYNGVAYFDGNEDGDYCDNEYDEENDPEGFGPSCDIMKEIDTSKTKLYRVGNIKDPIKIKIFRSGDEPEYFIITKAGEVYVLAYSLYNFSAYREFKEYKVKDILDYDIECWEGCSGSATLLLQDGSKKVIDGETGI